MGPTHFASSGGKAVLPLPGVSSIPAPLGSDFYLGVVGIIRGNSFYTLSFRKAITSIIATAPDRCSAVATHRQVTGTLCVEMKGNSCSEKLEEKKNN